MFQKLTVVNFQRHKRLTVKFDPRVTVIVGDTDKGKSALVRALFFLCLNKLSGGTAAYVRKGKTKFSVTLDVDDNRSVRRSKSRENVYVLDGRKLKAVGKAPVPEDVAKLLNVTTINFQRQLDTHFWFSDSPGQVAKNLNEIVNLELIDDTLRRAASQVRKSNSKVELCRERYAEAKQLKRSLAWVPRFVSASRRLRRLFKERQQLRKDASEMVLLLQSVQSATRAVKASNNSIGKGKFAVSEGERLRKARSDRKRLEKLITDAEQARELVNTSVPDIRPLVELRAEADAVAEDRRELEYLIQDAVEARGEICRRERELAISRARLKKLGRNRRCPECGRKYPSGYSPETYTCHTGRRYSDH